ncbi:MAG: hypothetical protein WBD71_15520, partial [Xanthobacteraceae bacterium]
GWLGYALAADGPGRVWPRGAVKLRHEGYKITLPQRPATGNYSLISIVKTLDSFLFSATSCETGE